MVSHVPVYAWYLKPTLADTACEKVISVRHHACCPKHSASLGVPLTISWTLDLSWF
jgi:hypothetical protein